MLKMTIIAKIMMLMKAIPPITPPTIASVGGTMQLYIQECKHKVYTKLCKYISSTVKLHSIVDKILKYPITFVMNINRYCSSIGKVVTT